MENNRTGEISANFKGMSKTIKELGYKNLRDFEANAPKIEKDKIKSEWGFKK